jgi:hypothetical protein
MDGFSSAEEAWLSSITETLRTWRYVMQETYESPEAAKRIRKDKPFFASTRNGSRVIAVTATKGHSRKSENRSGCK